MENVDNINALTDEQLEEVVTTVACSNDGVMENIKNTVEVNPDAELESEVVSGPILGFVGGPNNNGRSYLKEAIKDVFDNGGQLPDLKTENIPTQFVTGMSVAPEGDTVVPSESSNPLTPKMSEEEMLQFVTLISRYKKDNNYPVYKNMPESMKTTVRELAMANGIPASGWNQVAKMILEEFVSDSKIDEAFVDLEKTIDEALNIPSVVDMYSEHTKNVMETYIPEMAEKVKEEFPDKAARLLEIRDAFIRSYTFSFAKESYTTNARVRKAIKRWETEGDKVLDAFNYLNSKSNFKMNDALELPAILQDVLMVEPEQIAEMHEKSGEEVPERYKKLLDLGITVEDIIKFCILICKSCVNLDPENVVDAAYMYYMIKNIIVLKHTQEAKTDFAIELINNICDVIIFIRNKEDEFNESMDKSKSGKKHKSNKQYKDRSW